MEDIDDEVYESLQKKFKHIESAEYRRNFEKKSKVS